MLPRTLSLLESGIHAGLHIGAQLFISLRGQTVANVAVGQSRPGDPMTPDTAMLWLSAGKPLTAAAIAILWQQNKLQLDDHVADHIPEFAVHGKAPITIRHLLTHTAGFRGGDTGWPTHTWDQIIARVCNTRLEPNWIPGKKAGYHLHTSWFILGEIIRRLSGQSFDHYLRDHLLLPLKMTNTWFALPPAEYQALGNNLGIMQNTTTAPPNPQTSIRRQPAPPPAPAAAPTAPSATWPASTNPSSPQPHP